MPADTPSLLQRLGRRASLLSAGMALSACLLLPGAGAAMEPPSFAIAIAGLKENLEDAPCVADTRAILSLLASKNIAEHTGLAWRLSTSEHLAADFAEADQTARQALAGKPSLVICTSDIMLKRVLMARTDATPVFVPEGVPVAETTLDGIPSEKLKNIYFHSSSPDSNPKLGTLIGYLGAKRIGLLHVDTVDDIRDLLPTRAAYAAAKRGCETVAVGIAQDSYDECLKGMRRLAALKPDAVYLGHLRCTSADTLSGLIQPLLDAGIPAVGTESLGEASAGALMAFYQRAGTMERRNAYRLLRILFANRKVDLPPLEAAGELAVNMETASMLGIHLPMSVLADAEYIIWKTRKSPIP